MSGVAALGNFDGVHAGHRVVLGHARDLAASIGSVPVAAVFSPHPRRLFRPDEPPFRLMNDAQRERALLAAGAQRVDTIRFDAALAAMTPEEFVREVLVGQLALDGVVTGADFCFGKGRAGNAETLKALGAQYRLAVTIAPTLVAERLSDRAKFSSSAVRHALREGDVKTAAELLGRPWAIEGEVAHGDKRGRTLGFPTANISLGEYLRPKAGVYAVKAVLPGRAEPVGGVANIGKRPTVDGTEERLEVFFFDYSGDLYSQTLEVELIGFIREERRFDGLDALKRQIAADSAEARALLDQNGAS
ncbi:riboflavin biosynthesis protein [Glycocaulis albus]|uniref:Riboflavin biosynthesis protein n=1 Tax=Glycocaulis albus TaxID=1382801 RepID=A0ABQ1XLZ2_9PROT|nr:bifunctional riboflavin kinase/FAD synthetase [Glycocaulis albus]GGG97216.1 riboflavin biosynthesis protein [Glycocaulis albus]